MHAIFAQTMRGMTVMPLTDEAAAGVGSGQHSTFVLQLTLQWPGRVLSDIRHGSLF